MKIALSVGHSVLKNGVTTSADGVVNEYRYNKELADYVQKYLEKAGHTVRKIVCPEKMFSSSREERTYKLPIINKGEYDLAVELHLNAYNEKAKGTETYYVSKSGKIYAESVNKKLATVFTGRGAKKINNLYFLNQTKPPAILVETFFCDNVSDCKLGEDKEKIGKLIAEGIHQKPIK